MSGRVAKLGIMFEHAQPANGHLAARRGTVVVEHMRQRLKQEFIIGGAEAGIFREERGDETVARYNA